MNRTLNTQCFTLSYDSLEPEVKVWFDCIMKSSGARVLRLFFLVYSHGVTLIPMTEFPANSGHYICFPRSNMKG